MQLVLLLDLATSLREKQEEVIVKLVQGKDVFGVLPTGYGKSLCYACLPWLFDKLDRKTCSIVIVITPLIAIMIDQVCIYTL